jgi:hypothetical protein
MEINDTWPKGNEKRDERPTRQKFFGDSAMKFKMQICSVQSWLLIIISFHFSLSLLCCLFLFHMSVCKTKKNSLECCWLLCLCFDCLAEKDSKIYYGNSFWGPFIRHVDVYWFFHIHFSFHLLRFWVARFHVVLHLSHCPIVQHDRRFNSRKLIEIFNLNLNAKISRWNVPIVDSNEIYIFHNRHT